METDMIVSVLDNKKWLLLVGLPTGPYVPQVSVTFQQAGCRQWGHSPEVARQNWYQQFENRLIELDTTGWLSKEDTYMVLEPLNYLGLSIKQV